MNKLKQEPQEGKQARRYPKDVTSQAWAIMDQRLEQSRSITRERREEIYYKIPEIQQIDLQMRNTGASVARAAVASPKEVTRLVEQLAEENQALQQRRSRLLEQHGFPKDYLKEYFQCERCNDTGYQGTQRCSCFEEILRQQAFAQLNHVIEGDEYSFGTFRLDYYPTTPEGKNNIIPRERMGEVLAFCQRYAATFSPQSESLLMLGHTGLGKTHLSLAIAYEVIQQGYGVVYTPVQQLMDRLEINKFSYDSAQKEKYAQDLQSVLSCDLLVLDDLGTEMKTVFTTPTIYNIVNSRLMEKRPTIISTNLDLEELEEKYYQRMVSRLMFGYRPLRFYGSDIRFQKRRNS